MKIGSPKLTLALAALGVLPPTFYGAPVPPLKPQGTRVPHPAVTPVDPELEAHARELEALEVEHRRLQAEARALGVREQPRDRNRRPFKEREQRREKRRQRARAKR